MHVIHWCKPYPEGSNIVAFSTPLTGFLENHETEFATEFLMCNGCFWCACFYGEKNKIFEACPICNARLESIPILNNEQFKISHSLKAGFSLEFRMKK